MESISSSNAHENFGCENGEHEDDRNTDSNRKKERRVNEIKGLNLISTVARSNINEKGMKLMTRFVE